MGRCSDCEAWNSFVEEIVAPARKGRQPAPSGLQQLPLPLAQVTRDENERILTHIGELDRVLGGGIVQGSLVLIGGDPGIGKSTLLLQAVAGLSRDRSTTDQPVLYISGEESATQLRMRGDRLGVQNDDVYILTETSMEIIKEQSLSFKTSCLSRRFDSDCVYCRCDLGAGQCHPSKREHGAVNDTWQITQYADLNHWPRDQRRGDCRPAGLGTYGRYRSLL